MLALLLIAAQTKPFVANAELGKPYRVGVQAYIIGTKTKVDMPYWRTITVKSFRTAQAFGGQGESIIAEAGQKLLLIDVNIKNPNNDKVQVTTAETLRTLIWEANLAKSFRYIRAFLPDGGTLRHDLKTGQAVDVTMVLSAPEHTPFVHLGLSYERNSNQTARWFDVIPIAQKSKSVFSTDGFNFGPSATVAADAPFELDAFRFAISKPVKKGDHYAVTLIATNTMRMPASWGWQYSVTELQFAGGAKVTAYPSTYEPGTDTMWGGELTPGQTKRLEYRFYNAPAAAPTSFTMKLNATQRQVTVDFSR
ncbi:MAG: hypothetical protein IT363_11895 [Methanoregulaceae archaeon]|nr:hypothetical protein [Methanoregulaceae archaeon]